MKLRARHLFLFFTLGLVLIGAGGCKTNPPSNSSVRPWNAPQDWNSGMPIQNEQHN
ncbi:MAG: hypothetical protein ACLQSR_03915 [Limisphaerales bacterium]